ncbi:MAG: dTDP-4-dehydrorhamnose reductase [Xanthomonadales bacterium]|nr:dTDP-4-dehydrorhamnose reductase [Xanthomonadales bacterium]
MNILLTGSSGQLGTELYSLLLPLGLVTLVDRSAGLHDTIQQDLTDLHQFEILLNRLRPDLIVNTAAYTAVDQAEKDHETAFRLNAELPACIARWCKTNQRKLLHYSTDYVFDGVGQHAYRETDPTGPINVYGDSKLAGELAIKTSGCKHIILRTSWVYSTHGNNFLLTMLRLAKQRPELGVVSDQTGCPTWARNLARASLQVLQAVQNDNGLEDGWATHSGTYHYCDATITTWYDFARVIFAKAVELSILNSAPVLNAIASKDFPQLAIRPMYSVLDTQTVQDRFGVFPPGLDQSLSACLQDYHA